MEQLNLKFNQTKKAIVSLGQVLKEMNNSKNLDSISHLIIQDSAIKRFEYSIDTLWKYLKLFLEEKHRVVQKSPKTVFKELFRIGILTEQETKIAMDLLESRNLTSHTYNEDTAEEVFEDIPKYYEFMEMILEKTKP